MKESAAAILFPHATIAGEALSAVLMTHRPLLLCLPWEMVLPESVSEAEERGGVRILRPPEALRPEPAFRETLKAYLAWMAASPDRGWTRALAWIAQGKGPEGSIWEIRSLLKGRAGQEGTPSAERILRWHLVLHLSRGIEEARNRARSMLQDLTRLSSPLSGALEPASTPENPLKDLGQEDPEPTIPLDQVPHLVFAWLGLFQGVLPLADTLLTFNPDILAYVDALLEGRGGREIFGGSPWTASPRWEILIPPSTARETDASPSPLVALAGKRLRVWTGGEP